MRIPVAIIGLGIVGALSSCAAAHEAERDAGLPADTAMRAGDTNLDAGTAASDADTGLAPPCEMPRPDCVHLLRSARAPDDISSSLAREARVPTLVVGAGIVEVLTEVEDPAADRVLLETRRFDRALTALTPSRLDSMSQPPLEATGMGGPPTLFAWNVALGRGTSQTLELRWRTVDAAGSVSELEAMSRPWDETHIGPVLVDSGASLALTARPGAIDVLDLAARTSTTLAIEGILWDSIGAASLPNDPGAFVVLWYTIDDDGFARAMLVTATTDGMRGGPVTALEHLTSRASLLVTRDAILVAGFERTTEVAESRLRIARFAPSDLSRRGGDASFAGWGGSLPAGIQLVSWHDVIWLAWLTNDPRFGADAVLFVEALDQMACAGRIDEPLLVSSAPFDWTRRAAPGQMSVAVGEDALYVAHTIGDAGLFDIHALAYGCP